MEYSKEDLMEAKKQIWGVGENMGTEESKKIWEENAQFWDNAMGDESNEFHREVVRPKVTELLKPNPLLLFRYTIPRTPLPTLLLPHFCQRKPPLYICIILQF